VDLPQLVVSLTGDVNAIADFSVDMPQLAVNVAVTGIPETAVVVTLPQLTVSLAGDVNAIASIDVGMPPLWMADPTSFNMTVPMLGMALTAAPGRLADAAMTLPAASSSFASGVYDLAMTLPALSCAFAMEPPTIVVMTLPALQGGITAVNGRAGPVSMVVPSLAGEFAGGVSSLSMELPAAVGVFSGQAVQPATMAATLPSVAGSFSATLGVSGAVGLTLPRLTYAGTASATLLCNLQIQVSPLVGALVGAVGSNAPLQITLPSMLFDAAAYSQISAGLAMTLPRVVGAFRAQMPTAQLATLIVNTLTNSTVTYEQYPYNSFAEFNGMYLAAGPGGLYQIETGGLDDAAPILANLFTGEMTFTCTTATGGAVFGPEYQKRVASMYVGMRSENELTLVVATDEDGPFDYQIDPHGIAVIKQRRAIIGKGLRGKYWKFGISNDGGDFGIDSMNITAVPTSRRI
jgi:hypothetical protein